MKPYLLLIFFVFCTFHLLGQQKTLQSPAVLSRDQKMIRNFMEKFYKANKKNEVFAKQLTMLHANSCHTVCPVNSTLPVDGLELKGERLNEEKVKLKWHTFSETNNKGFVVERQFSASQGIFDSIGFVKGVGNSLVKSEYTLVDLNSFSGKSLYRLRQVDFDGKEKYSNTISVNGSVSSFSIRAMPNPASSGNIAIEFKGYAVNDRIKLLLLDAKGSIIYSREQVVLNAGNLYHLTNLPLSGGVYLVRAFNGTKSSSTTLVVK